MVDVKTAAVSVVAVLSFLQPGIRSQPTIDSSTEGDSCSQLKEELEFQVVENMHLRSLLENERHRQRSQKSKQVTVTLIRRLGTTANNLGITKVDDMIYVLRSSPKQFIVYEDRNDFRRVREVDLHSSGWTADIVYSNNSKCVYIRDISLRCILVMTTTGEHRLISWMTNVNFPDTLSLSNEGNLLVLREGQSFNQLDIYSLNASLIGSLRLREDIIYPKHVVQTSDGNFIILHRLNNVTGPYVISQLTSDGHLIHRFIPRNQSEKLFYPTYLSLDSENNRLFVADSGNSRVILLDSSVLTWSQVLVSREMHGIYQPERLFYDASKKRLFVAQSTEYIFIYEIH